MAEKKKKVETPEVVETENGEVTEEKKGFFKKVGGGIKKHGKKVLFVGGALAGTLVAFAAGKGAGRREAEFALDYNGDDSYDSAGEPEVVTEESTDI